MDYPTPVGGILEVYASILLSSGVLFLGLAELLRRLRKLLPDQRMSTAPTPAKTAPAEDLLALYEGARLLRDIPKDQPIALRNVELPSGRQCDKLRAEQPAALPNKVRVGQTSASATAP